MYAKLSMQILPRLIPVGSRILVAVSGGPDSIALAHILWRYMHEHRDQQLSLVITHVNHKARKEADQEAMLVRKLAEKWELPFILHEFNAKEYASFSRLSFQEAAREWRYARWQEDMKRYNCELLATAHHLGDQAETVLYRLLRGSGTAGLAGIYPAKDKIIRPLLGITKQQILDYCMEFRLPYAVDHSNNELVYDRNRIRLQLIPELEKNYNKRIQEALGRTAELLRWDEEYINSQVEKKWTKYCRNIKEGQLLIASEVWGEPEAILSRIIRKAAVVLTGEQRGLEYKFIKTIMETGNKSGWKQDLPGLEVQIKTNGIFFFRKEFKQQDENNYFSEMEIRLIPERWYSIPGLNLQIGLFSELLAIPDLLWFTEFDADRVANLEDYLICRFRRPGDKMYFRQIGHKSMKKIFQEYKIPVEKRKRYPVIAYNSQILWLPGLCRSDNLLPAEATSTKLYALIRKTSGSGTVS
ncbi:MAG: tRNA lysidine(34) synthetase TilS [Peptococcaceae bacterium]|jgi:tRNA(Ile)-lysidine synthase|nr:tRNA lysidine(34) synthetase TilS [Peptococcaceae bacterium]